MKSERGQSAVLVGLLLIFVVGIVFFALSSTLPGMKQGADTIAEELVNIEQVVSFHVNSQRIYPNKHSIESHGEFEATLATNCYNDHGTFMIMANKDGDFYFPCREEDGKTVRLTVWTRESSTSNVFHMKSAYTPMGGNWAKILRWLQNTHRATKASAPQDIILVIDGVIP